MRKRPRRAGSSRVDTVSSEERLRLFRCLSLDLEVGKDGRIRAFAGIHPDTGQTLAFPTNRDSLATALAKLDDLAKGADFLLGHNLIAFDLPHLKAAKPGLRLLQLPAVDTLRLNPLAFPRNPYHHLVKHYQDGSLRRGRVNDPALDAGLALDLFRDQLETLRGANPELLTAWHWLTTTRDGPGFDKVFNVVRRSPRPADYQAYESIRALTDGDACQTHTREIVENAGSHNWGLAYALAWLSVSGGNSVMPPWVRHQFPEAGRLVKRLRDTMPAKSLLGGSDSQTSAPNRAMRVANPCKGLSSRRSWRGSMCLASCQPAQASRSATKSLRSLATTRRVR